MIFHEIDHNSPEWFALRMGKPTASMAKVFIGKRGLGEGARTYARRLVTEKILSRPMEGANTLDMQRGHALEERAAQAYTMMTGIDLLPGGFATDDTGFAGASPDRLTAKPEKGMVEIKCPRLDTHMGYVLDGFEDDYFAQAQFQLFIFRNRAWVDRFSYHPEAPVNARERTYRHPEMQRTIKSALIEFQALMEEYEAIARQKGIDL